VSAYESAHPDTHITVSLGSTGSLVAQIRNGAPFDVLLAADMDYPRALLESGHAEAASLFVFAHGRLCLWPAPAGATAETWPALLAAAGEASHIAIAQPDTAPYGRAARRLLEENSLWTALSSR